MGNGCAGRAGDATPVISFAPHTKCSPAWGWRLLRSERELSFWRPASGRGAGRLRRRASFPLKNHRSPGSLLMGSGIKRSPRSSSSAIEPSSITWQRYTGSSASVRAPNWPASLNWLESGRTRRRTASGHKGHELWGHGYKRAHHFTVLVLQDVTVVHVPTAVGGEANGDLDDLVGIDPDGVLESAFVVIDRVAQFVIRVAPE